MESYISFKSLTTHLSEPKELDAVDYLIKAVSECPNCDNCAYMAKEYFRIKELEEVSDQPKYSK